MKEHHDYHHLSINDIYESLITNSDGLTKEEANHRLQKFGYNKLPEWKRFSALTIFLAQFKNPLIYILFFAIIISFATGHYTDWWIILFVTMISSVVGFLQEYKANNTLQQLKSLITYQAKVIRDWKECIVHQEELVPGDIILLAPWDKIPADARLIEIQNFEVIESSLTGESLPIEKHIEIIDKESAMADRKNMIYLGTIVSRWTAKAIVTATWTQTEIGHIAKLVHETEEGTTPLQKQILHFGKVIGIILIILNIIVFGLWILIGKPVLEMFLTSVSMVVAAVPEWLLPAMTIILAVGMQKLAKKKWLVRKMLATETLWAVSVICSDKTGTLTQGEMRVMEIVTEASDTEVLKMGLLCNDAIIENPDDDISVWKIIGNPTEKALLLAGQSTWLHKHALEAKTPRKAVIPFESQHKYMVTHHALEDNSAISYMKWAPEKVLPFVSFVDIKGKAEELTQEKKKLLEKKYEKLTATWLRVIAVAYKKERVILKELKKETLSDFVFMGFIAFKDPLRQEVKEAIKLCQNAGMTLKVITWDHKLTTIAIVNDLGIHVSEKHAVEGKDLDEMSDEKLREIIKDIVIFARVEPRHKIRIVTALQSHGNIVAMTGDGVNDAPALKKADIGVAVWSWTDVAKETADLILLDDNFNTIVEAVRRWRGTFDNIRKVILYLLSNSFKEVILISLSIILGMPLALLPVQILWIKMIEDSFPSIALAFDPTSKNTMSKPPRNSKEPILNNDLKKLLWFVVIISDLSLFALFYFFWKTTGDIAYVQTIAFVGLGIASRFYIYSIRGLGQSIFSFNIFENRLVNISTIFGFAMIAVAIYVPFFNKVLHTVPLWIKEWIVLLGYGLLSMIIYEIGKKLFVAREAKQ